MPEFLALSNQIQLLSEGTVWDQQLEFDPYELMALDWVPDKSIQSEILPGENAVRILKNEKKNKQQLEYK